MPPLPPHRTGEQLRLKDRPISFSFWPVEKTTRRFGLGSRVFATDPWTVIRRSIESNGLDPQSLDAAKAILEQSKDFFDASTSGVQAAKPLLLYYCFMNLAKAFVLSTKRRTEVDDAQHGLKERLYAPPNDRELTGAFLGAFETPAAGPVASDPIQVFDELLWALAGHGIPTNRHNYDLPNLMPQIVPGHRLWVEGTGRAESERFVTIEDSEIWHHPGSKSIWVRFYVFEDDLKRINITHGNLLTNARVDGLIQEVQSDRPQKDNRKLLCFEQIAPVVYNARPSDKVDELVAIFRPFLWRTVLSQRPYRQFYFYPAPAAEHDQVLPQIMSIYAITYYLGSIVRYRPHHFDDILAGEFGPFIEAFLNDQPNQFIYLMASEFAQREVTKAAIV